MDVLKIVSTLGLDFPEGFTERCARPVELRVVEDGESLLGEITDAEAFFGYTVDARLLARSPLLRWIQSTSGGVEKLLIPELMARDVRVSCIKGVFAVAGAEHAIGAMLMFSRGFHTSIRDQAHRRHTWTMGHELRGQTVGILGLGSIGREVARLSRCLGMRVVATARTLRDEPAVDELYPGEDLHRVLRQADFVVVTLPCTPATVAILGAAELRVMKRSAWLIDITGRKTLFDEAALIEALSSGRIAGANYQIQQGEPPQDSPLWTLPNVVLSVRSANSEEQRERALGMILENIRRYCAGEELLGAVDKAAGY